MSNGGPITFYPLLRIQCIMMLSQIMMVGVMVSPALAADDLRHKCEANDLAVCVGGRAAYLRGTPRLAVRACTCYLEVCDVFVRCPKP